MIEAKKGSPLTISDQKRGIQVKKTSVLFLCIHNSARSQMAEGLLRRLYSDKYEAYSAGATPTGVHPLAVLVMVEIGIDISGQYSKSIEDFRGRDVDLVVTVCKRTLKLSCPFCSSPGAVGMPRIIRETIPGAKRFVEHGFSDPSDVEGSEEEILTAFRCTRNEIREWIQDYFFKRAGIGG